MPSEPQKRKSLGLELPHTAASLEAPPGIAALFAIRFDIRTGYVIAWKRSVPDVEVEGVVEYKSLPSGLHNVTEDLIYFVHEQYAGLSAFVNLPAEEAERNAKMFAVGVLVPLSFGRLGKSWRHASKLQELVQQYAQDTSNSQILDEYWEKHQVRTTDDSDQPPDSPLESPISVRFKPSERPDAALESSHRPALTQYHPASSLPHLVDSFGPLIFPLYRAALLRKRILLMVEAPVHVPCNYVYDLSLLASLPNSILPLLPPGGLPSSRPRPLFNVGIHDIPILAAKPDPNGPDEDTTWIACSTDSVLSMKPDLYDVLVTLPAPYTKDAPEKVYPKLTFLIPSSKPGTPPSQAELKATQRDASRYVRLRRGIRNLENNQGAAEPANNDNGNDNDSPNDSSFGDDSTDAESTYSSSPVVEPVSWTRLAYTSFIWWASAGEKREGLSEEEEEQQIEQDTQLMASIDTFIGPPPPSGDSPDLNQQQQQQHQQHQQPAEVALVAYFRRLTAQIFIILADAIARQDADGPEPSDIDADTDTDTPRPYSDNPTPEDNDNDDDQAPLLSQTDTENTRKNPSTARGPPSRDPDAATATASDGSAEDVVLISTEDMTEMGLDVWSITDRVFVEELVQLWWGRRARVDSARIRCCGITIL